MLSLRLVASQRCRQIESSCGPIQRTAGAHPSRSPDIPARLLHRNADHDRSHDIIDLEVPFGAILMGIVAADASLGYCEIGIDGLEVTGPSFLHNTGMGFSGMSENSTQACFLKLAGSAVPFIDRPEADQPILDAGVFFLP